ncbi:MAG: NAD(+) synthase [Clostridia bacterium]|nr:NAD(+) synthase [Clostridia bacterium]
MTRDYKTETEKRVAFIRKLLADSHAEGIIFGNSGGKDSALVGILCKMACSNTVGIIMPCQTKRNFQMDYDDGMAVAKAFDIETRVVDVTPEKEAFLKTLAGVTNLSPMAAANINPRLRMIALYAIGQAEGRLVAGTGNRSEIHMGYFTKWGDGAYDFNPIADLTVREIYEFLKYLNCPSVIIEKEPSGALFEGQTDEKEMGVSYAQIDSLLLTGDTDEEAKKIIERYHRVSGHKRRMPAKFKNIEE